MFLLDKIKNHRLAVASIFTAGIVAVFWLLWFFAATRYQSVVDHWIEIGRSEGYDITYDRREQFGFPRRAVLRYVNLRWKNTDGVTFHAGDLDISAGMGETQNFKATFKGQVELDVPTGSDGQNIVLAGEGGETHVTLGDDGTWERVTLTMSNTRFGRTPDYLALSNTLNLTAERPADPPKDVKHPGLTLSAEADDMTLPAAMPPSFGPKMAKLHTDLRVMGPLPDFRVKDSVAEWNKKYGIVNFDKLDMSWGALLLTSKGTMGFDDDLQPEGAFDTVVGHQDRVLKILMKSGFIASTQEEMLGSAMRIFAKPGEVSGTTGVELPVAVQLDGMFLGPVKVFAFPPIEW
jgi:hypothetical protein